MSDNKDPKDPGLSNAVKTVAVTALVFTGGALALTDVRFGLGVLAGGAIAVANLLVLARVVQAFLSKNGNTAPWAVVGVLKLVALLGGVYLILKSNVVPPVALVIGYMSLPVGAVVASVFGPKPPDEGTERAGDKTADKK